MTTATLPAAVAGYISGGNAFDGDAVIACFAEDAFVNDARREFRGNAAIRRWLEREVIGDKVTMAVSSAVEHHGDVAVHAVMDGTYDKTGLPDPLVLSHYFTIRDGLIVGLIIVRNEPTPAWAEG